MLNFKLNFDCFAFLVHPFALLIIWLPVIGFLIGAMRAWKKDRQYFRMLFPMRDRWKLATPFIVVLEMIGIAAHCRATHIDIPPGFYYLFLSLIPLMCYLVWRFRRCCPFAERLCLAQLWLALWVVGIVAATMYLD